MWTCILWCSDYTHLCLHLTFISSFPTLPVHTLIRFILSRGLRPYFIGLDNLLSRVRKIRNKGEVVCVSTHGLSMSCVRPPDFRTWSEVREVFSKFTVSNKFDVSGVCPSLLVCLHVSWRSGVLRTDGTWVSGCNSKGGWSLVPVCTCPRRLFTLEQVLVLFGSWLGGSLPGRSYLKRERVWLIHYYYSFR